MSLGSYVQTFAVRLVISLALAIACFVGVKLSTQHDSSVYHFPQTTVEFELILYSATASYELLAALIYLCLLLRSRAAPDLSHLNSIDRTFTCLFCIFRVGFTISLSIILISQAAANTAHDYSSTYTNGSREF